MDNAVYKWRVPGLFKGVDPEKVNSEIDSLGDSVMPAQFVEFARNPNTESHKCFEWDDTEAARKYRIDQAKTVLRSIVVEVKQGEDTSPIQLRVRYVTEGQGYKPTKLIMSNPSEYEALKNRAFSELRSFRTKYDSIHELHELFEVLDGILQ